MLALVLINMLHVQRLLYFSISSLPFYTHFSIRHDTL